MRGTSALPPASFILTRTHSFESVAHCLDCPTCDGNGVIDDENGATCGTCHGNRHFTFTVEYKHFGSDLWGYELPTFIEPSQAFVKLLSVAGWDYFAHELIEPCYIDGEQIAGFTPLTDNVCPISQRGLYAGLTDADYYLPL